MHADALARGIAEEDVVMAAAIGERGPFVAQDADELAGSAALARQALELAPLGVVEPDVVLAERREVEARVLGGVGEERAGRALPFGERGVAVGLAPEDEALRRLFDAHRVAARRQAAVRAAHLETMDADAGRCGCRPRARAASRPAATRPTTVPSSRISYAGVGPLARFIASSSLRTVTENGSPRSTTEGPSRRTAAISGLPTIAIVGQRSPKKSPEPSGST